MTLHDTLQLDLEVFSARYAEQAFELIDGDISLMAPVSLGHAKIAKRVFLALSEYESRTDAGETYFETPFVLVDQRDWVKGSRVPDVMFIRRERLDVYRQEVSDEDDKPLVIVPDLVVEIVSAKDRYAEVQRKIRAYLRDGVRLLWLIDPQNQNVAIYRTGSDAPTYAYRGDTLSGETVLPDFTLAVETLLPEKAL